MGAEEPCTINHLAKVVGRALGREPVIRYLPERREVKHAYASHERVKRVLGPQPLTPLEEGIARMAAWAKAKGPRRSKAFAGVEVHRNLPSAWRETLEGEKSS